MLDYLIPIFLYDSTHHRYGEIISESEDHQYKEAVQGIIMPITPALQIESFHSQSP